MTFCVKRFFSAKINSETEMNDTENKVIMDEAAINRAITRISYEIIEKNKGVSDVVIIGILRRGIVIAERIAEKICKNENCTVEYEAIDVTPYRDDKKGAEKAVPLKVNIQDKKVILVDDVLYTGRTVRAAIDALMDNARAKSIQLAVLVDRGHRELPIRPDYVGKNVPTSKNETVRVNVNGFDNSESVEIIYADSAE